MKDEQSILVFKSGRLDLIVKILSLTDAWAIEQGLRAYLRNTPDGYEIYAAKSNE